MERFVVPKRVPLLVGEIRPERGSSNLCESASQCNVNSLRHGAMFFMHADLGDGDSDWTEYVLRVCKTRNTATMTGTAQGRLQYILVERHFSPPLRVLVDVCRCSQG